MVAQLNLELSMAKPTKQLPVENRATRRRRVILAAKVAFGATTADCTIRDISESGARVHAPTVLGLPEEVHLLIFREGRIVRAKRIWADFPFFGLKFLSTEPAEGDARPDTQPLRDAWGDWLRSQSRDESSADR